MKKIIALLLALVFLMSVATVSAFALDPKPYKYGDVSGDDAVTVGDATIIQRHLAKVVTLSDFRYSLADVNDDGNVNVVDATFIQQYVAKIITEIPREPIFVLSVVNISSVTRSVPDSRVVGGTEVSFTVHSTFNLEPDVNSRLSYEYDLKSTTAPSIKHFEATDSNVFTYTFPKAGIYVISVKAYDKLYDGYDEAYIVYHVNESYPFDNDFVYVEYDDKRPEYALDRPVKPENCDIEYEMMYSESHIMSGYSERLNTDRSGFACVIDTKEQYDNVFKVDSDKYDDGFFKENSLIGIVTNLGCLEAEGVLGSVCVDGDTLFINVYESLDLPPGMGGSPVEPFCILIAKVSKSDVENVTDIDWVS
ncbi:MAG: dockerin type I repeat-containing protein [Ruminococcus sp.]|nr:dockerin type I repeat-containing protein [Ruminococcus sp.]